MGASFGRIWDKIRFKICSCIYRLLRIFQRLFDKITFLLGCSRAPQEARRNGRFRMRVQGQPLDVLMVQIIILPRAHTCDRI